MAQIVSASVSVLMVGCVRPPQVHADVHLDLLELGATPVRPSVLKLILFIEYHTVHLTAI